MNKFIYNQSSAEQGGYVALLATIIIGAVLLVATVDLGMLGAAARFSILGTEAKEEATFLAVGCIEVAVGKLLVDTSYRGWATTTSAKGTCYVFPFEVDVPATGLVTFKVQAIVRQAVTNLVVVKDFNDIHLASVPESAVSISGVTKVETVSSVEVATLP